MKRVLGLLLLTSTCLPALGQWDPDYPLTSNNAWLAKSVHWSNLIEAVNERCSASSLATYRSTRINYLPPIAGLNVIEARPMEDLSGNLVTNIVTNAVFPYVSRQLAIELDGKINELCDRYVDEGQGTNDFATWFNVGRVVTNYSGTNAVSTNVVYNRQLPRYDLPNLLQAAGAGLVTNGGRDVWGRWTNAAAYWTRQPPMTNRHVLAGGVYQGSNTWTTIPGDAFGPRYYDTLRPAIRVMNTSGTFAVTLTGTAWVQSNQTYQAATELVTITGTNGPTTNAWRTVAGWSSTDPAVPTGSVLEIAYQGTFALYGDRPWSMTRMDMDERYRALNALRRVRAAVGGLNNGESNRWSATAQRAARFTEAGNNTVDVDCSTNATGEIWWGDMGCGGGFSADHECLDGLLAIALTNRSKTTANGQYESYSAAFRADYSVGFDQLLYCATFAHDGQWTWYTVGNCWTGAAKSVRFYAAGAGDLLSLTDYDTNLVFAEEYSFPAGVTNAQWKRGPETVVYPAPIPACTTCPGSTSTTYQVTAAEAAVAYEFRFRAP